MDSIDAALASRDDFAEWLRTRYVPIAGADDDAGDDNKDSGKDGGDDDKSDDRTDDTDTAVRDARNPDAVKRALDESRQAVKEAEKRAREAEAKVREHEDKDKSEKQRAEERAERAEKELETTKHETLKLRVAASKGLPSELVDRLQGSTERELKADADRLLELVRPGARSADGGARRTAPQSGNMDTLIRRRAGRA